MKMKFYFAYANPSTGGDIKILRDTGCFRGIDYTTPVVYCTVESNTSQCHEAWDAISLFQKALKIEHDNFDFQDAFILNEKVINRLFIGEIKEVSIGDYIKAATDRMENPNPNYPSFDQIFTDLWALNCS